MTRPTRIFLLAAFAGTSLLPLPLHAVSSGCHEGAAGVSPAPAGATVADTTKGHEPAGAALHAHHERSESRLPSQDSEAASAEWQVEGRYLDACRCNAPCPCHFGVGSDYGTCDPTLVFHISAGYSGNVRLDGLTAVLVTSREKARLYLDDRGDPDQRRALEAITRAMTETLLRKGFRLPGDQTVSARPIRAVLGDDRAEVSIPGVLDLAANSLVGGDGASKIGLHNLDLGPSWMEQVWAGRSEVYRYTDAATWDYGGRNAYFGRFRTESGLPTAEGAGRAMR